MITEKLAELVRAAENNDPGCNHVDTVSGRDSCYDREKEGISYWLCASCRFQKALEDWREEVRNGENRESTEGPSPGPTC